MGAEAEPTADRPLDEAEIEELAEKYLAWESAVEAKLKTRSDQALRDIQNQMNQHGTHFHERVAHLAQAERGWRYSIRRARELGCECYCPIHDCDAKNCPKGVHA